MQILGHEQMCTRDCTEWRQEGHLRLAVQALKFGTCVRFRPDTSSTHPMSTVQRVKAVARRNGTEGLCNVVVSVPSIINGVLKPASITYVASA